MFETHQREREGKKADESDVPRFQELTSVVPQSVELAMRLVMLAEDYGADEHGLLLLVRRYLPILVFVTRDTLRSHSLSRLPGPVRAVLESYAAGQSDRGRSQCLPVIRSCKHLTAISTLGQEN